MTLPDRKITLFHHHGQSESTRTLTEYLAVAAPDYWPYTPSISMPEPKSEAVPDEDVADKVTATDGPLAYAPMDVVKNAKLAPASLDTGADEPVFPDTQSLTDGAATADVLDPARRDMAMKADYNTTADNAYPIFRFGYAVVCAKHSATTTPDVRPFLNHVLSEKGQKTAAELGYGPLPESLSQKGLDLLNRRR